MRQLQKKLDQRLQYGQLLSREDHITRRRLEREVDNILLLDDEGKIVYQKK